MFQHSFKFDNANVHGIWCDVVAAQWFATHDEAAKKKERPKGSTWVAHFLNFHSGARSGNRCTAILLRGLYQWPHRYKWLAMFCSLQHPGVRACWSEDWFGLMPLCHFGRWILTYYHCRNSILVREAIRESDRICMSQKKFFIAQLKQWKQHAAGTQWTSSMPHAPWRVRRYSWKRSRLWIMETDGAWWRLSSLSYINSDQYWSIFINVYQCLSMLFNIYQCLSKLTMFIIIINVYQYLSMFINIYQCLSMFINVYQCSSIFINVYQN